MKKTVLVLALMMVAAPNAQAVPPIHGALPVQQAIEPVSKDIVVGSDAKGAVAINGTPDKDTIKKTIQEYKRVNHIEGAPNLFRHPIKWEKYEETAHPRAWRVYRTRVLPTISGVCTVGSFLILVISKATGH